MIADQHREKAIEAALPFVNAYQVESALNAAEAHLRRAHFEEFKGAVFDALLNAGVSNEGGRIDCALAALDKEADR